MKLHSKEGKFPMISTIGIKKRLPTTTYRITGFGYRTKLVSSKSLSEILSTFSSTIVVTYLGLADKLKVKI